MSDWAQNNITLRKAMREMDAIKKAEQQQEMQRQFHQQMVADDVRRSADERTRRRVAGL